MPVGARASSRVGVRGASGAVESMATLSDPHARPGHDRQRQLRQAGGVPALCSIAHLGVEVALGLEQRPGLRRRGGDQPVELGGR